MNKKYILGVVIVVILLVIGTITVLASTANAQYYAHSGTITATGGTIAEAIAAPDDGKFIQLAPWAWVTLKFPGYQAAIPDGSPAADLRVDIYDAEYPAEAEILVSLNGTDWTSMGVWEDTADIDLDVVGPVKYIKVDQADHSIAPPYLSLGFDLDGVVALNAGTLPYGEITKPAVGDIVSGVYQFEALYWDDDPAGVQWAIRKGTCAANTNTVWGNVDLHSDPYSWDKHTFQTTADTTSWEDGSYCFVFNPTESGGEEDIRLTQFNVVNNDVPPVVDANGPYAGEVGKDLDILGTASDADGDSLTYTWTADHGYCTFGNSNVLDTTVKCQMAGSRTLTLTVSDGTHTVTDTALVTITDPLLTTSISNCTHETYTRYTYIETKFVSSLGTEVESTVSLDPGNKYLIEASGVFYAGGTYQYDIRADAKYTQDFYQRNNNLAWTDDVHGYESSGTTLLELKVDGAFVNWGTFTTTHRYKIEQLGTGSPVTLEFQIYDTYPSNNTGGLCVSIYKFNNTPPVANPGGPYLGPVNTAISFDGSTSSDPDGDPMTYAWTFGDGGDGSGATPTHAYTAAGIYDVCLTVNDGLVDSTEACTLAVVYDPSAGFVTGGGWINSPVEAYATDPTLSGKATFGFVAKYKKGANVPDGSTEFQFKAGALNFHSTSYQWLVVAGDTAQFKGEGTINGQGNYKFMIWADDDSQDTFRIKIWEGEDDVIYDSNVQPLGGGSIVVHN